MFHTLQAFKVGYVVIVFIPTISINKK